MTVKSKKSVKKTVPLLHKILVQTITAIRRLPVIIRDSVRKHYRYIRHKRDTAVHKSFSRTLRRDIPPQPYLERPLHFIYTVWHLVWSHRKLFVRFLILFIIGAMLIVGLTQQDSYLTLSDNIKQLSTTYKESGVASAIETGAVFAASIAGGLNNSLTETQQIFLNFFYIIAALIVVWLLRQLLSGNSVTLRDGIYNAGAPIISLLTLVFVGLLQMIPAAIAVFVYSAAVASGLLEGGIENGAFAIGLFLIIVLTLYYLTTTVFAMMVATLPGVYPLRAYASARKIIQGQRLRMLVRFLLLAVVLVVIWAFVLIPIILGVNALNHPEIPLIPLAVQLLTGFSIIYGGAYIYLLYRRMIDDPRS